MSAEVLEKRFASTKTGLRNPPTDNLFVRFRTSIANGGHLYRQQFNQPKDLLRLVVGQGILLVVVGTAIGIAAAIGVMRFMSVMLYGIRANDPATFAAVAMLLTLVALLACFIPARRAMRVDPMVALRYE